MVKCFWLQVLFVECFAATVEEVVASSCDFKVATMLTVPDAVVGADHWLVLGVADLVKSGNDRGDEVWSESAISKSENLT